MTKRTPAWLLERMAQGELDGAEAAELRSRLAAQGRSLDEAVAELRQSDRQILTELPRDTVGASIRRRAALATRDASRSRLRMLLPPLALAGTLGLVVVAARGVGDHGKSRPAALPATETEDITIKGDETHSPRLLVYRQRPGRAPTEPELLPDGARGARGDLLQLAYDKAPKGRYGVLISLDGAGKVTRHLPEEPTPRAAPLVATRELRLGSAYELDDAPGFERFVLVTGGRPFAVAVVLEAAEALAKRGAAARTEPLSLGPSFHQTTLLVNKTKEGNP